MASKPRNTASVPATPWRNRIVGQGEEDAGQLLANPGNWRIHSAQQQKALGAVLDEIGWCQNIIVNKRTGHVVDGHLRVALAISKNERVPVVYIDVSEEEERLILATIDPLSAMAGTDEDLLAALRGGMPPEYVDIADLCGPAPGAGTGPVDGEDDAPEPPAVPVSVLGDLWLCGQHRVLCGDSTSVDAIARLRGATLADLMVTDPPYGVSYADKNAFLNAISRGNCIQTPISGDHQKPEEMAKFWVDAFTSARTALRNGAAYYVTGPQGGDLLLLLLQSLVQSGFPLRHMLIWAKNNHVLGRADYNYKHEPIIYGWADHGTHKFYGPPGETSLWQIDKPLKSDLHPTMKPVELFERAIRNSSQEAETVLDPFLGSGTNVIACEKTGRICYGLELAPEYVDVIVNRWQDFTGKHATLDGDGRTFAEIAAERVKAEAAA